MLVKKRFKKSNVCFRRLLHAVGQGAFFTEQFFVDGKSDLNVIYDCGSLSKKGILDAEINRTFAYDKTKSLHVDVLFISHLDKDHISGIPTLEKLKCIDDKTIVILPFSYPLLLFYLLPVIQMDNGTKSAIQALFKSNAKILGVDYTEGFGDIYSSREIILKDNKDEFDNYSTINNVVFKYERIWNYIPFMNINDSSVWRNFFNGLKSEGLVLEKLKNEQYVEDNLDKLKKIYSTVTSKSSGGVTPINICSLQVLSFKNKDVKHEYVLGHNAYLSPKKGVLSCLFSGDTIIDNVFVNSMQSISNYLNSKIELLQIPHHGRKSCYDTKIYYGNNFDAAFANYDSTYKKSSYIKTIETDMNTQKKDFFHITELYYSDLIVNLFVWIPPVSLASCTNGA